MHVGDGIVPLWLLLVMYVVSGAMLVLSARRIRARFDDRLVPYMGVLAAVIYAAQYVNFPVSVSSGHLIGATMIAVMVGPYAGALIMALVLFVQVLGGDGGILTYGLNTFNMAVFSCFVGWALSAYLYRVLAQRLTEERAVLVATSVASYVTTVAAALVLGIELFTVPGFGIVPFTAIVGIHALIGIGEAVLTFVILLYFVRARPNLISFLSGNEVSEIAQVGGAPWATPEAAAPTTS